MEVVNRGDSQMKNYSGDVQMQPGDVQQILVVAQVVSNSQNNF
jgi:hypothetical protein